MPYLASMSPTAPHNSKGNFGNFKGVVEMRRELAEAERILRWRAEREAAVLAEAERAALREARNACRDFDRIRPCAELRLAAIQSGEPEQFSGEAEFAERVLREAAQADAAFTIISFASRRHKLRYLRGGEERQTVVREALQRGGVYNERNFFQGIVR